MRNHRKVKSIRAKFGATGYAIWSMILEYLTGNDGNVFEFSDMEFEMMSGDFGVPAAEIREVVNYCIILEMLFNKDGFIHSPSLDDRLAPVYQKRGIAKELSEKQRRTNGRFCNNNTESHGVSVTEIPQSKVKQSKAKEIPSQDFFKSQSEAHAFIMGNYQDLQQAKKILSNLGWRSVTDIDIGALLFHFLEGQINLPDRTAIDIRQHFTNWLNKRPLAELTTLSTSIQHARRVQG